MSFIDLTEGLPSFLTCSGGNISIETKQVKQGSASLRWDFKPGGILRFNQKIGYCTSEAADSLAYAFGIYIFGTGSEGTLRFSFTREGRETAWFNVLLGFSGWRSVNVCFDRDMEGIPCDDMEGFFITASAAGAVLLSEIVTANPVDSRLVVKSYQTSFIKSDKVCAKKDWTINLRYAAKKCCPADIKKIEEKTEQYLQECFLNQSEDFTKLAAEYSEFGICGSDFGLCGKRVEFFQQRFIVKNTPWQTESYLSLRKATDLLLALAVHYRQTKNEEALRYYKTLLEYISLQGFAEGSSLGTLVVLEYALRPFYTSLMLMHEELSDSRLLSESVKASAWFLQLHTIGIAEEIPAYKPTSDTFFNTLRGMLFIILTMEKDEEKSAYLYALSDWLNSALCVTPGLESLYKEDGCIFHHCGHYIAYGAGGLQGLMPVLYALEGTAYDVNENSKTTMKNVLQALSFQCNGLSVPVVLSGRHPNKGLTVSKEIFDYMPYNFQTKASGNMAFPMACASVHKRKGFTAVAKGFSKYLWGSEIYLDANHYGRYLSYGTVELINEISGFSPDGYDWNRLPGATTIHLPFSLLRADIKKLDDKSGYEEMLLSDQSFAGGISHGENGMFSMILTEHPKYNGTHKAYKTVIFYESFILMLGSEIANESEFATETTLYQNSIDKIRHEALLNGKPFSGSHVVSEDDVLTDGFGNCYYIKAGAELYMTRKEQVLPSANDDHETRGCFETAVLKHGISPQNASYEYGIAIGGSIRPDYKVLRQDSSIHAVRVENLLFLAIFQPGSYLGIRVSEPVLMVLENSSEHYKISLLNPDLGLYKEDSSQFDEKGLRKEVSIYSREWTGTAVSGKRTEIYFQEADLKLTLTLKGGEAYRVELPSGNPIFKQEDLL